MPKAGQPAKPSPALKGAWELLEAGDVLAARRKAREVLQAPASPAEAEEARALLERTRMPRQALWLAALAAAVMALLVGLALLRAGR